MRPALPQHRPGVRLCALRSLPFPRSSTSDAGTGHPITLEAGLMRTRQIDRKRGGQRFSTGLQMRNASRMWETGDATPCSRGSR